MRRKDFRAVTLLELIMPQAMVDWWAQYAAHAWTLTAVSALTLVASVVLVPWLVVLLPADFYAERGQRRRLFEARPFLRAVFLIVKNAIGTLLLGIGAVLVFLPGPGILAILAGLALLDFPGKRTLELRLLHLPKVLKVINRLRMRAGRPPLSF